MSAYALTCSGSSRMKAHLSSFDKKQWDCDLREVSWVCFASFLPSSLPELLMIDCCLGRPGNHRTRSNSFKRREATCKTQAVRCEQLTLLHGKRDFDVLVGCPRAGLSPGGGSAGGGLLKSSHAGIKAKNGQVTKSCSLK